MPGRKSPTGCRPDTVRWLYAPGLRADGVRCRRRAATDALPGAAWRHGRDDAGASLTAQALMTHIMLANTVGDVLFEDSPATAARVMANRAVISNGLATLSVANEWMPTIRATVFGIMLFMIPGGAAVHPDADQPARRELRTRPVRLRGTLGRDRRRHLPAHPGPRRRHAGRDALERARRQCLAPRAVGGDESARDLRQLPYRGGGPCRSVRLHRVPLLGQCVHCLHVRSTWRCQPGHRGGSTDGYQRGLCLGT